MYIEFVTFLKKHEILSQFSALGTPQQNGVAERRNRTLLDMVKSMMSLSTLPLLRPLDPTRLLDRTQGRRLLNPFICKTHILYSFSTGYLLAIESYLYM